MSSVVMEAGSRGWQQLQMFLLCSGVQQKMEQLCKKTKEAKPSKYQINFVHVM